MIGLNLCFFLIDSLLYILFWVIVMCSGILYELFFIFVRKLKFCLCLMFCRFYSNLFMGDGLNFMIVVFRFLMSVCLGCSLIGLSIGLGFFICILSVFGDLRL